MTVQITTLTGMIRTISAHCVLLLAALVITSAQQANSKETFLAGQWYAACKPQAEKFDGHCFGFLHGLASMAKESGLICMTGNYSIEDLVLISTNWIDENPSSKFEPAHKVIFGVMASSFPCS